MAKIECCFLSETLELSTVMTVILPISQGEWKKPLREQKKIPVLWLLHGASDDHTAWTRKTSIERYVEKRGIAVVMPEVARSYYADMEHGLKYWTFISEELPAVARRLFPLSEKRSENFVAGLSMGGYGALKLALSFPERYAAAASLSGVVDPHRFLSSVIDNPARKNDVKNIFGSVDNIKNTKNDLYKLVKNCKKSGKKFPKLFQCCGTGDFLYQDNLKFRDFLKKSGVKAEYKEGHAVHEWGYWDTAIQDVLRWLPKV